MAKRSIDQQLADLHRRQAKDRARTEARALLDNAKTALHRRAFVEFHEIAQQLLDLGCVLAGKVQQGPLPALQPLLIGGLPSAADVAAKAEAEQQQLAPNEGAA